MPDYHVNGQPATVTEWLRHSTRYLQFVAAGGMLSKAEWEALEAARHADPVRTALCDLDDRAERQGREQPMAPLTDRDWDDFASIRLEEDRQCGFWGHLDERRD